MDDPRITALSARMGDADAHADGQTDTHAGGQTDARPGGPTGAHTTLEGPDTLHGASKAFGRSGPPSRPAHVAPQKLRAVETEPASQRPPDAASRPDLRPLADQLMAIAAQLRGGDLEPKSRVAQNGQPTWNSHAEPLQAAAPAGDVASAGDAAVAGTPGPHQRRRNAVLARNLYAARRRRGAIFDNPDLFGEPAWDILLDLYIAHVESKDVSVSSACIGSAAPPTTGLRWLGVLADEDLVCREHDPADQRRVLVRLTAKGLEAMDRYFADAGGRA